MGTEVDVTSLLESKYLASADGTCFLRSSVSGSLLRTHFLPWLLAELEGFDALPVPELLGASNVPTLGPAVSWDDRFLHRQLSGRRQLFLEAPISIFGLNPQRSQ